MTKEIVNRSVSFNVVDPYQRELCEYTRQFTNFSAYIKRLIQRDMEGGKATKPAPTKPVINCDKSMISGLI